MRILPVFGAHPLSNVFNRAPIWLVEGEDDERVWQHVVRSSKGSIRIYPCSVDGITSMNNFEQEAKKIMETVYDDAKGYSLRDRDDNDEEINDVLPLVRIRLAYRTCENLLLSNEVLKSLGYTWEEVKILIDKWLIVHKGHQHYTDMINFRDSGYDRKSHNIKILRNDLMGMVGSNKPLEVVVGKAISDALQSGKRNADDGGILNYLGERVVKNLHSTM